MESLARSANRGSVPTGYEIANSLKLEADNSEYMVRTMTSTGNRKTFTLSVWLKRTELKDGAGSIYGHTFFVGGNAGSGASVHLRFSTSTTNSDSLEFRIEGGAANYTNKVFRDTSAWYHIVFAVDTTQATESNRIKLYVNGVQETSFAAISYPSQDTDTQNNFSQSSTYAQEIGAYNSAGSYYGKFCGYLAEYNHVDGQQLAPTEFGETDDDSGIWKPKEYTGSYGTNGFYLDFEDSSSLGADDSGNGNNFTLTNIAAADQATDTPTNNFCTPLLIQNYNSTDSISHTEGGTKLTTASGTGWRTNMASVSLSSGKWYFEAKHPGTIDGDAIMTSIVPTARFGSSSYASFYGGQLSGDGIGWYWDSTRFRYDDGSTISPPTNTVNSGDILGIALDMDNNFVYSRINGGAWHNNGSADGDPTSGSSGTGGFAVADEPHMICTSMYQPSRNFFVNYGGYNAFPVSSAASDANGRGVFEYAPPSGYFAICTKNLAEFG